MASKLLLVANSLRSRTTATPSLNSNDLVIERAQIQPQARPLLEMILNSNSTAAPRRVANGDILVKSRGTDNRGLVDTLVLPDGIRGPITCKSALDGALLRRVQGVFDNIVLDEGVGGPAVYGEEASSASRGDGEGATKGNGAICN